jgi:dihydrodipicolinate synthase/N-acetylneuraminate lyase
MPTYTRSEIKDWAREHMQGVCNVIIPSYTADLKDINETGIRHDVRRNIELGFWGALLVSEAGTTLDEMRRFMEIAVDEAQGRHHFVLQAAFDTPEDIIEMGRAAADIGVDALLLGQPNSFYPQTPDRLEEYTRHICASVDLAVVLFIVAHSNLARLDPSGYPREVLERVVHVDNVAAVKYELGRHNTTITYETFRRLENEGVLLSDPMEYNAPIWIDLFGMQWMGTSNYEYYGDRVPRMFSALGDGRTEEGMALWWAIHPVRQARARQMASMSGANFIHRYLWKYQAWLNGYNGGPIRQPAMKLTDDQMRAAVAPLIQTEIAPNAVELADFFVGRNPA